MKRFTAVVPVLLAACGNAEPASTTVRDSAGIRIVESASPAWQSGAEWRVDPAPSLEIGVADGEEEYELYRVWDAVRLPDGGVLVSNSGSHELRFYDAAGRYVTSTGRRGEGPGEFAEFSAMRLCAVAGDSLIVDDSGNGRQAVFSGTEFVRTLRLEAPDGGGRPFRRGCFGDGTLLITSAAGGGRLGGEPGSVIRTTWDAYRYASDGSILQMLRSYEDRPRYVNQVGSTTHFPFVPFHAEPVATAAGDHAYFGDGAEPELRRVNSAGAVEAIIRWKRPDRRRTADAWSRYTSESLAEMNENTARLYGHLYEQSLPIPEYVPAYSSLTVDSDGHLWLERFRLPWDTVPLWDVFDSGGSWLGQVATPARLRVLRIYGEAILGRHLDESGVERIRIHRLARDGLSGRDHPAIMQR